MNKRLLLTFQLLLVSIGVFSQQKNDWANFSKYEEANKTAPHGAVVFMGNSITEGWVRAHPDFFKINNYIGRGIGGQVSSQMLVRFRRDVIELMPRAVVILAGTNDIAQNSGYISLDNIMSNIKSMCELAKANNIQPVLCSVLPASEFRWRKEIQPASDIVTLNRLIKAYADANKFAYVDYHTAMKDDRNGLPAKYAEDGVHPTSAGYDVMEKLVQQALNQKSKKVKNRQYLFSKE